MLVSHDLQVTLRFSVEQKLVLVQLRLKRGQDARVVLQALCAKEAVPVYLEGALASALAALLRLDYGSFPFALILVDGEAMVRYAGEWAAYFATAALRWRLSSSSSSGGGGSGLASLPALSFSGATESVGGRVLSAKLRERFERAFSGLANGVNSNDGTNSVELLLGAEDYLRLEMESLLFKRQGEIDALRERQSREMDKAVRSNLEHLTALVEQHVGEIELKEDAWRKSIQLEMAKQKRKFIEYVVNNYEGDLNIAFATFEGQAPSSPPSRRAKDAAKSAPALAASGKLSDSKGATSGAPGSAAQAAGSSAFRAAVGLRTPTVYAMSFVVAPLISFLHARMHDRTARAKACQSLYGSSLAAVVLPVERALNYSTAPTASAFAALCTSSTELHFEPLHDQIDFIKSQLPAASSLSHPAADLLSSPPTEPDAATSAGSASATFPVVEITQRACVLEPVREGDTFVTRHSNLGETQIVYHLVCPNTKEEMFSLPLDSPLVVGFRNIVAISSQYDVATLSFPLLLADVIPESFVNHDMCLTRAAVVLRIFKTLLLMLADTTIKTVRFLLPPQTSAEMLGRYEKLLASIFSIQS